MPIQEVRQWYASYVSLATCQMVTLENLTEYVRQVNAHNSKFGDKPEPSAPPDQLAELAAQCRDVFQIRIAGRLP